MHTTRRHSSFHALLFLAVVIALCCWTAVHAQSLGGPPPGGRFSTCCDRAEPRECTNVPVDAWFTPNTCEFYEGVTGISCETREHFMALAFDVPRKLENTPCPQVVFGALVVNHTAGPDIADAEILCSGHGNVAQRNLAYHAEFDAFDKCSEVLKQRFGPGAHTNPLLWQQLTMYATGEPCAMDAQLFRWAKLGEVVYGLDNQDMEITGWTQPSIHHHDVQQHNNWCGAGGSVPVGAWGGSQGKTSFQTRIIKGVGRTRLLPYFFWGRNPGAPCPPECMRDPTGQCRAKRVVPRPPRN